MQQFSDQTDCRTKVLQSNKWRKLPEKKPTEIKKTWQSKQEMVKNKSDSQEQAPTLKRSWQQQQQRVYIAPHWVPAPTLQREKVIFFFPCRLKINDTPTTTVQGRITLLKNMSNEQLNKLGQPLWPQNLEVLIELLYVTNSMHHLSSRMGIDFDCSQQSPTQSQSGALTDWLTDWLTDRQTAVTLQQIKKKKSKIF